MPALQISNDELAKIVDTSDEWIATRTGIRKRRVISGLFLFLIHGNGITKIARTVRLHCLLLA